MLVQGKRIIVTGGASGIGAETVRVFAREGAAVVSVDINDEAGQAIADQAHKLGSGSVTYRHLDVSNADEVNAVFDESVKLLGGLDALAAMAGNEIQKPAEEFTPQDFDSLLGIHVKGTAFTNQAAFRYMRDSGGSIINYSSYTGVGGIPSNAAYGAAKGAILSWTRTIAKEWGRYGIRANAVCPGVMTAMAEKWFSEMTAEKRAQVDGFFEAKIALGGKLGKPEDAANLNLFLVSDLSKFITAQTIGVDGGMTATR